MRQLIMDIRLVDFLDVLIVSLAIYRLLLLFRRTRSNLVLFGMAIVAGIYVLARQFDLRLTTSLLQAFFTVLLLAVVIIFQEEIRQFFERLASRGLPGGVNRRRTDLIEINDPFLVLRSALPEMARKRIGGIVVLPGSTPLDRHLSGGFSLGGKMSMPLFLSLFDTHSPGHDGAIVVDGDRIGRFGCRLPLSTNAARLQSVGTRHAAAVGLSEVTDAVCLVVSEERGIVSVAHGGEIELGVSELRLDQILESHFVRASRDRRQRKILRGLRSHPREKLAAFLLSALLWFFMVHEGDIEYRTLVVPVEVTIHSSEISVNEIEPPEVRTVVSGSRRDFYFFKSGEVRVSLKLVEPQPGRVNRILTPSDFTLPGGLVLEDVKPKEVRITLRGEKKSPPVR